MVGCDTDAVATDDHSPSSDDVTDAYVAMGEAEARGDWVAAIAAASRIAECFSHDHDRHSAHLRHMDLLAKAGLIDELTELAKTDVHARRSLDEHFSETGRDAELRHRAEQGDEYALYKLVRLLRERGDQAGARRAVDDIAPTNAYARQLADGDSLPLLS